MSRLRAFVNEVVKGLPEDRRYDVRAELLGHLNSAFDEMRSQGVAEGEAESRAMEALGPPARLRRRLLFGLWRRDIGGVKYLLGLSFMLSVGLFFAFLMIQWDMFGWLQLAVPALATWGTLAAARRMTWMQMARLGVFAVGFAVLLSGGAFGVLKALDPLFSNEWAARWLGPLMFLVFTYVFFYCLLMGAAALGGRRPVGAEALALPVPAAVSFPLVAVVWSLAGALDGREGPPFREGPPSLILLGYAVVQVIVGLTGILAAARVAPLAAPARPAAAVPA